MLLAEEVFLKILYMCVLKLKKIVVCFVLFYGYGFFTCMYVCAHVCT